MGLKPRANTRSNENKTQATKASVRDFIRGLDDDQRRRECDTLVKLMREVSGEPPVMWGSSIVGFGSYHYRYESGREGDAARTGFSPRKQALTIYCVPGFERYRDLLAKLGPHKSSVSCLYVRKLADIDLDVLRTLIARSLDEVTERYGA